MVTLMKMNHEACLKDIALLPLLFDIFFVLALLQKRVDEIARLNELRRRDHERSFRLVCNPYLKLK